jgi:hypothetical protein
MGSIYVSTGFTRTAVNYATGAVSAIKLSDTVKRADAESDNPNYDFFRTDGYSAASGAMFEGTSYDKNEIIITYNEGKSTGPTSTDITSN